MPNTAQGDLFQARVVSWESKFQPETELGVTKGRVGLYGLYSEGDKVFPFPRRPDTAQGLSNLVPLTSTWTMHTRVLSETEYGVLSVPVYSLWYFVFR